MEYCMVHGLISSALLFFINNEPLPARGNIPDLNSSGEMHSTLERLQLRGAEPSHCPNVHQKQQILQDRELGRRDDRQHARRIKEERSRSVATTA